MRGGRCLVLNSSFEFLNITPDWFHGVRLIAKGRATPLAVYNDIARADRVSYPVPAVVVLKSYVRIGRTRPQFSFPSKRNILIRDNFTCAYCECRLSLGTCTREHVIPTSRGGKDDLLNVVSACSTCNHKKADRTPGEAGMTLKVKPRLLTDEEKINVLLKTHRSHERQAWLGALSQHNLSLF
jgi:5-methylcytosine-specific restriction endonuclease McrA